MNKKFKTYLAAWAVLFALFQVISFVSTGWSGTEKYTPSFWVGYVFITLAFLGQLVCSYFALKEEKASSLFYRIPLLTVSYSGLILSFVVGGLCMLLSPLPYFVGVIVCAVLLAVYAIALIKANAAAEIVENVDRKVKAKTLFVKSLSADAEGLLARARSEEAKAACKKVYEAVRYSDPMSNEALAGVESQITLKFGEFANAVTKGAGNASSLADELVVLIDDRNRKSKLVK